MSNVLCVAWRVPCSGLRPSSFLPSKPMSLSLSGCISSHSLVSTSVSRRLASTLRPLPFSTRPTLPCGPIQSPFSVSLARSFVTSGSLNAASAPPVEHGIKPRAEPFSQTEINAIFGPGARVSPHMGNRILAVLHGRRLNGTPELDLPKDITSAVRGPSREKALEWLREHYPLDEDAAILARFEREEREEEEKLIRRAESLGLYKPQSGSFGAELGESNDPSGRSILQETRQRNEARILKEEEKRRQEWLAGEGQEREKMQRAASRDTALQTYEESGALEARPRADPSQRPFLAWVQKHHLRATEWDIDISHVTTRSRLLPAFAFTAVALGLCYVFALYYEPPAKKDRLWPTIPPAAATVLAIIGANVCVYALWKICPPAWSMLNRYFIVVAAYPRTASLVGNVFSHQTIKHLAANMVGLWFVGTRLHDDIGRGNFLAVYFASGIFGSLVSLTANVLLGKLTMTALGASGALSGIIGSLLTLHADQNFTLFFIPKEWQETVSAPGHLLLAGLILFDLLGTRAPLIGGKVDNLAHLGGILVGVLWATAYKRQEKERFGKMSWFERLFWGESK